MSEKPSPKFQTKVFGVPSEVLLNDITSFVQTETKVKLAVGTGFTIIEFVIVSEQPLPPNEINVTLNVPAVAGFSFPVHTLLRLGRWLQWYCPIFQSLV